MSTKSFALLPFAAELSSSLDDEGNSGMKSSGSMNSIPLRVINGNQVFLALYNFLGLMYTAKGQCPDLGRFSYGSEASRNINSRFYCISFQSCSITCIVMRPGFLCANKSVTDDCTFRKLQETVLSSTFHLVTSGQPSSASSLGGLDWPFSSKLCRTLNTSAHNAVSFWSSRRLCRVLCAQQFQYSQVLAQFQRSWKDIGQLQPGGCRC